MKTKLLCLSLALWMNSIAMAGSEMYQYLQKGGDVSVSSYGGVALPTYVYKGLEGGLYSPFMQLILQQHIMAECTEEVKTARPDEKTPFTYAKDAFANGVCRLTKCFQQMMVLDFLAQSSSNPKANGGSTDAQTQNSANDIALQLYQMTANLGCDSKGDTTGGSPSQNADPNLLNLLK